MCSTGSTVRRTPARCPAPDSVWRSSSRSPTATVPPSPQRPRPVGARCSRCGSRQQARRRYRPSSTVLTDFHLLLRVASRPAHARGRCCRHAHSSQRSPLGDQASAHEAPTDSGGGDTADGADRLQPGRPPQWRHEHRYRQAPGVRPMHARQRGAQLPGPGRRWQVPPGGGAESAQRPEVPGRVGEMPEEPTAAWWRLMGRKLVITAVVLPVVLVVGGVAARALLSSRPAGESGSQARLPPATAEVTRTTLVETKTVSGTLGYGDAVPVGAVGAGTLTWIAAVGSTVQRGQPLFKLDERPVVALYGAVPVYRTLRVGVAGVDVKQLEENLSGLGYKGFTVDNAFTAGTAAAVRDWQNSLGLPVTGAVESWQVVFTPGPVRVAAHTARVGAPAGRGEGGATVLSYTDTTRLATVDLKVADQALAVVGGKVTVTIPGGRRLDGTMTKVGTVATMPDQGTQAPPGQSGPAAAARIAVTVDIADQQALGTLEAAPVDVDFVSQKREGVLTVPVAALLALPEGGYGLEIVEGSATRIVAVKPGLFAAGRVEINGDGIEEGMKVGVPK